MGEVADDVSCWSVPSWTARHSALGFAESANSKLYLDEFSFDVKLEITQEYKYGSNDDTLIRGENNIHVAKTNEAGHIARENQTAIRIKQILYWNLWDMQG